MTDIGVRPVVLFPKHGFKVIPGSFMQGGEGLVHLSYATSLENIREGIGRLNSWLSNL